MRLTCAILAALVLAACPPRRSRVVYVPVQPRVQPVVVAQAPSPHEPPIRTGDPAVDAVLVRWEQKMAGARNWRTEITFKYTVAARQWSSESRVKLLCMKPHFASLWFDSPNNPKSFDDIRFVCDGKSVFRYDSTEKTITEQALPAKWPPPIADPRGGMLFAVNTKELAERFDIILLKTDTDRIYLDFMPRSKEDKRTFEVIRVALHGPGAAEEKCDYVPEQISMLKVNGDIDIGKFDNTQVNLPDVGEKDFAPVLLRGWRFTKAPWAVTPNIEP